MKKFTSLNENFVNSGIQVGLIINIRESDCNAILEKLSKVIDPNVMKSYGYDKLIKKVVEKIYIEDRDQMGGSNGWSVIEMYVEDWDEEDIEQEFLELVYLEDDKSDNFYKKLNEE